MGVVTRKNFTSNFHHDTYPALQARLGNVQVSNKAVFVTGSGTGIGAATALSFAKAGARAVFLSGRTLSTLEETEQQIKKMCPKVIVGKFVFDISEGPEKAEEVFSQARQLISGQPLDIFVNNAGFIASLPTVPRSSADSSKANGHANGNAKGDFDRYWRHFEVNVKGPLALAAAFLQHATPQDPTVINITSGAAVIDFVPGLSGYGASKLAALKMFSYLHYEQTDRGLKVFHVHPGVVATAMAKEGNSKCDDTGTCAV